MLKKGDKALDFQAIDQNGKIISLKDYKDRKVIVFFYPKDNTPGCTNEVCNLRDNYQSLLDNDYAIIGISADSEKSHKRFSEKHNLPFPLLPDINRKIIEDYGVWKLKKFMGREKMGIVRTTFIIDKEGFIERIIEKVKTKAHAEQILETL